MHRNRILLLVLSIFLAATSMFPQAASSRQAELKQHNRLARQYLEERRPDLAIRELKGVVALDPTDVSAHANLGVLLFFRADYAAAVPQFYAALKLQPDLWKIEALLGLSEERIGDDSEGHTGWGFPVPVTATTHLPSTGRRIDLELTHSVSGVTEDI